jgi:hypothetical protein
MQRTIQVATVQLDASPAPTTERLLRADQLIFDAAQSGAELVVMPELFNTGYQYDDQNFLNAENADGQTITWMKRTARQQHVHLAGSLLLVEDGDIFNAMFIVSPSGQTWRYDKSFPWAWEHGYFRPARAQGVNRAVVAHTDLGDLGMLICWDAAHPEIWQAYAGQVDMMVICSSPPNITKPTFTFLNGEQVTASQLGPMWRMLKEDDTLVFGPMIDAYTAWLGVPTASSTACGQLKTHVPRARHTLLPLLPSAPGLARFLPHADTAVLSAQIIAASKILSADGKPISGTRQLNGEGFVTAEIQVADVKPQPQSALPLIKPSKTTYFISDDYLRRVMQPVYHKGIRQGQ